MTIRLEADDDFGLQEMKTHYSVNGGERRQFDADRGPRAQGSFGHCAGGVPAAPGDLVSLCDSRDARATSRTDMFAPWCNRSKNYSSRNRPAAEAAGERDLDFGPSEGDYRDYLNQQRDRGDQAGGRRSRAFLRKCRQTARSGKSLTACKATNYRGESGFPASPKT